MSSLIPLSRLAVAGLAVTAVVTGAGCDIEARFDNINGSFDRTVQVSGPVELIVTNGAGDVTVRPGADGAVHVVGRIRAAESLVGLSAAERVERIEANPPITQSGNLVSVGEISDTALRNNLRIDYDITTPAASRLRSRSGSGDLIVESIQGPVDVSAGSGDLQISAVTGPVTASTGSGDIQLRHLGAGANARTGSGDVELMGVAGALRVRTGSGDIKVEGSPDADWALDAASGDVELHIPAGARFTLDASSSSGHVRSTHPIEETGGRDSRRQLRGQVGGGGPRIEVSTASGSIDVD